MSDSARISPTAHFTAQAWEVLNFPYASWFTSPLGRRLHALYSLLELSERVRGRESRLLRTLDNRHRLIEGAALEDGTDLVIELGAGLSRRGVTFCLDHGIRYMEVDLPAMVRFKRECIDTHASDEQRFRLDALLSLSSMDILARDFELTLSRLLEGTERPVVLLEGVLGYFDRRVQQELVNAIRGALAGRGRLVFDMRVKQVGHAGHSALLSGIKIATRGRGAAPSYESSSEVDALLRRAGFKQVRVLAPLREQVMSYVFEAH